MASTPYTYYRCPCASESAHFNQDVADKDDEEEKDFDPKASRANFSLYQLEQLLYCDTCQQIRCPKCILEEILCWYCPNCLFEVPSSTVKSEGPRCTRSCFECPCCQAPLSVTVLENQPAPNHLSVETVPPGPYALACSYCAWTSEEIGIVFEKHTNIYSQLSKIHNGGERVRATTSRDHGVFDARHGSSQLPTPKPIADDIAGSTALPGTQYANLLRFYQDQMSEASSDPFDTMNTPGFGSPASLSRLMGLYSISGLSSTTSKPKPTSIRDALKPSEGLLPISDSIQDVDIISAQGWSATASNNQRANQSESTRLLSSLRPVPFLLRTKRSKRCSACRSALIRPDPKITSSKFKLRLVATKHVLSIKILPFQYPTPPPTSESPLSVLRPSKDRVAITLIPKTPTQFILHLQNPIYHPVRVTLATPRVTPGPTASRVTLLCPQLEIGPMVEFIDDALSTSTRPSSKSSEGKGSIAEAGKVWDKGGNWADVVVEIVPGIVGDVREQAEFGSGKELGDMEDGDLLEIPIFVRVEWDGVEEGTAERMKRELAYWCVLGVGHIGKA